MSNRQQRVVTIHVGDYLDRLDHLRRLHEAAVESEEDDQPAPSPEVGTSRRLGQLVVVDEAPAPTIRESERLAEEYEALLIEAKEKATHYRLEAIPRRQWDDLTALHPPRQEPEVSKKIADADAAVLVNESTFREVLVPRSIVEVTEAGEVRQWSDLTEQQRIDLIDGLSSVDFARIYLTAFAMNRRVEADPKPSLG